ncbi:MAG TPA: methionyl-tRNA formyltransferase, partial [Patescibacteria group bacterium]|nr:methionyl-tRNA formyltransferase [Patescibacteria group bacterium]
MNVIFFGNSEYVIPIIKYLKDSFNLKLVITTEKETNEAVISYCLENKIDYLSVNSVSSPEVKDKITDINPAFAILANFRFILPKEILKIFPKGIINIHPSLLPKYRGATPGQTAILKDDKTTGVTIIKLDEEIDHGKIISQKKESILTKDTAKSLYIRLF